MSDAVFGISDAGLEAWDGGSARGGARPRRHARLTVAALVVAPALAIALAAVPPWRDAAPSESPAPTRMSAPAWLDIVKPVQLFSLQANELSSLPLVYTARRRADGAGREDVLAFGTLAGERPALRLRISRADASTAVPPLYVALARQAAEAGLSVGRSGLPDLMPTRFGAFEIADIALANSRGAAAPGGAATCSGFRLVNDRPGFTIIGLACGDVRPWPRKALACLVDRLDLASGGDDRQLIDFFAATELRRDGACEGMRLGPDTLHARWLDDKPATQRKTLRRR
jgi:hypothetical protein